MHKNGIVTVHYINQKKKKRKMYKKNVMNSKAGSINALLVLRNMLAFIFLFHVFSDDLSCTVLLVMLICKLQC